MSEWNDINVIERINVLKQEIDTLRPISAEKEARIMQKFRLEWNYHSNAIEGNKLSYGETVALLMEGITAKGKPLKDHLDIEGHNEAIDFLLSIVKDTRPISEAEIRELHKLILKKPYKVPVLSPSGLETYKTIQLGVYKSQPNHVKTATGQIHYYATPEETPLKMQNLMGWLKKTMIQKEEHPLIIASVFHHRFVSIHPFDDGNGRLSRLLMNLILMKYGFPPVVIKMKNRMEYYAALSQADNGILESFIELIGAELEHSLQIYLKGAKGESIDEPDDIDKEIALLKASINGKERQNYTNEKIKEILVSLIPLYEQFEYKCKKLDDLFHKVAFFYSFDIGNQNYSFVEIDKLKTYLNNISNLNVGFVFVYKWINLKSNLYESVFDTNISIAFSKYNYIIKSKSSKSLTKSYSETITKQEQDQIIADNIKSIIAEIKKHSK